MISRIPCNCGALININTDQENKTGWLMYEVVTENGLRRRGLCPKCQAAIKCYLDNIEKSKPKLPKEAPIKTVDDEMKEESKKRGRPKKK